MLKKLLKQKKIVTLVVAVAVLVLVTLMLTRTNNQHSKLNYPAYVNSNTKIVFSVPSSYTVNSQALPGVEVVHSGVLTAKTYDELYNAGNVTLEPITALKDQSAKSFKNYVNTTFMQSLKKKYPSSLIKTKYSKIDGWDVARVTVTQSGRPQRFVYLKNGKHPIAIVSKTENSTIKTINQSVVDVESSPLSGEITPLKQVFQDTATLIVNKNTTELYRQASAALRAKSTQSDLDKIVQAIAAYYAQSGGMSVYDGVYDGKAKTFNAIMNILPSQPGSASIPVAIYLGKVNNQWQLNGISVLTAPAQ